MTATPAEREVFRERAARIIALAKAGQPPRAIATAEGIGNATVMQVLVRARRRGEPVPRFNGRGAVLSEERLSRNIRFRLPPREGERLRQAAAERGVMPWQLVRALVGAVIADDLFAAVLER